MTQQRLDELRERAERATTLAAHIDIMRQGISIMGWHRRSVEWMAKQVADMEAELESLLSGSGEGAQQG